MLRMRRFRSSPLNLRHLPGIHLEMKKQSLSVRTFHQLCTNRVSFSIPVETILAIQYNLRALNYN
jgi:hypothetical protein